MNQIMVRLNILGILIFLGARTLVSIKSAAVENVVKETLRSPGTG
jgi:hypothetical protein